MAMSSRLARIPGARIGLRYLLTSLGFALLFHGGTFLWHQRFHAFYFREPAILGLTHLAALGWLTTGLMGLMYTTLPATLGVRPRSLRMAAVQYWCQLVGIAGLVLTMSLLPLPRSRALFGLLTLIALVLFAHNAAATIGRGKVWHLPEFNFVMALFYLAITGLWGMMYVFYLNSGLVPQSMVHLKLHAHFAGLGWLALTLLGLTYKLLPLELGLEHAPQRWGMAASALLNLVLWGLFFGFSSEAPGLMLGSALLGLAGLVCHALQVRAIVRLLPPISFARNGGGEDREGRGGQSLPYTIASCAFGLVVGVLGLLLTTGALGMGVAVEYAYAYAAGAGWFGMYLTGQLAWLLPMLLQPEETVEEPGEPRWTRLEFPGQVAGTALATLGLLTGFGPLVALGAALSLAATLSLAIRGVRLCLARPALVAR
jgi:hypothetical protein